MAGVPTNREIRARIFHALPLPPHHDPRAVSCVAFRHWWEREYRGRLSCSRCGTLLQDAPPRVRKVTREDVAQRLVWNRAAADQVLEQTEELDQEDTEL